MKNAYLLYDHAYLSHLFGKTSRHTPLEVFYDDLIQHLIQGDPITVDSHLIHFFSHLTALNPHFVFQRYSGKDNLPGLLDALVKYQVKTLFLPLDKLLQNPSFLAGCDFVIAPLEIPRVLALISLGSKYQKPIYPVTFSQWDSKYLTRLAFSSITIPFVYVKFSEMITPALVSQISTFFETKFVNQEPYIYIKEDAGFQSGVSLPYQIGPLAQLDQLLSAYQGRSVSLIIEPFLFSTKSDVHSTRILKIHAFHSILKTETLVYEVRWKYIQGKIGPDTIQKVTTQILDEPPSDLSLDKINNLIKKYLPFNMLSLEFVQDPITKNWYAFDINHACGSWGEIQNHGGNLKHTIFDHMVEQIINIDPKVYAQQLKSVREQIPQPPTEILAKINSRL